MSASGWSPRTGSVLRQTAGYSLVEMIVAIGAAAVVGMGIFALFNSQQKAATSRRLATELQTSCSLALGQVKQELLLAGYRAEESVAVKTFSAVNHKAGDATNKLFDQITFEYFDDKAKWPDVSPSDPTYDPGIPWSSADYSALTQVRYEAAGGTLTRHFSRMHRATGTYPNEISQVVATGIKDFDLELMRDDNSSLLHPVSGAAFDQIRNVGVRLTCQAAKTDKLTGRRAEITLADSVKPRNVGLESNPRDTSPPAIPTNLVAWDPGTCGQLELRWDANTEADLSGYTVYYGLTAGVYSGRARVNRAPQAAGNVERLSLSGLTPTKYTDATPAVYHIVVTATDKSSNQSGYSVPETSRNPTPSTRSEDEYTLSGVVDTTITIEPAPAPPGFAAAPGAEGEVNLSWPDPVVVGLTGFRLYRGTTADFVPDDTLVTGNRLADESALTATARAFVDKGTDQPGGHLKGCTTYFYKLAAIHCDPTIPTANLNFAAASSVPTDTTPPPTPVLKARPGFQRIILSLQNPSEAAAPDFKETKIWYSTTGYPTLTAGVVTGGTEIPDKEPYNAANTAGTFTQFSTRPPINFNSENPAHDSPSYTTPELTPDATYYFIAVAFDQCGRNSLVTGEAKAEGAQCNDCVQGVSDDALCYNAPPDIPDKSAEACTGPITITWDYPYLDQTDDYRDLTGFHVFRREGPGWIGGTNEVELTSPDLVPGHGDPIWLTTFEDASAERGKVYTYRIQATDCYYERRSLWPLPGDALDNPPDDNFSETFLSGIYTGGLVRDYLDVTVSTRLTAAVGATDTTINVLSTAGFSGGGNTIQIEDERITYAGVTGTSFTGCIRGAGGTTAAAHAPPLSVTKYPPPPPLGVLTGGLYLTPPQFHHNPVSLLLKNEAAGQLTLNQLSASWENSQAYLQMLLVGDGNTTAVATPINDSPPLTKASTGSTTTLTGAPIAALDTLIPTTLVFQHADGSVDAGTNMRQDTLDLSFSWRNDSTLAQCPNPPAPLRVPVPLGPVVSAATMDKPSAATPAVAVPGPGATPNPMNIVIVPGSTTVNVFADVADSSLAGIRSVKLYYLRDPGRTLTAAPAVGAGFSYPNLSPYTAIDMVYVAGNQWRTPAGGGIPVSDTQNVWFFILAVDNQGNFDREPEIDSGAYQYYQQQTDVCLNTPNPPGLTGTSSGAGVTLTLTRPDFNTDGVACTDFSGYKIYRRVGNGIYTLLSSVATTASPYVFNDLPPNIGLSGNDYTYYAAAYDSCEPPKLSSASPTFTECQGAPACTVVINPSRTPSPYAGDTFTVDLTICSKQNGVSGEPVWIQDCSGSGDADPLELIETNDTGVFRLNASAYGGKSAVKTWLTADYPTAFTALDLYVNPTDIIRVGGYSATPPPTSWDSTCTVASLSCSSSVYVVPDPCTVAPTAPAQAVISSIAKGPEVCPSTTPTITLSWGAVAGTTSYTVYRCTGSETCTPATQIASGVVGTTFTDVNPGGRLDKDFYRYSVQAVNDPCPSNYSAVRGPVSDAVTDPCP